MIYRAVMNDEELELINAALLSKSWGGRASDLQVAIFKKPAHDFATDFLIMSRDLLWINNQAEQVILRIESELNWRFSRENDRSSKRYFWASIAVAVASLIIATASLFNQLSTKP